MVEKKILWQKKGRIIAPSKKIDWLYSHAGPAFALADDEKEVIKIYITGRDQHNRSLIGSFLLNMDTFEISELSQKPVLSLGIPGSFDENGVSYPYIVQHQGRLWMYYVGWMPTVVRPFNLQLGLAIEQEEDTFLRYSKAPILPRTDDDFLSIGSACVLIDGQEWKMWYTSFLKWGSQAHEHKHYYTIKYATSKDGIHWQRSQHICIPFKNETEYAISRPTVWKEKDNLYHLWYTFRGDAYRIGYAISTDGIHWERLDHLAGIDVSTKGWDAQSVCYPHVFTYRNRLFMLYNGNDYGREGLGIAEGIRYTLKNNT